MAWIRKKKKEIDNEDPENLNAESAALTPAIFDQNAILSSLLGRVTDIGKNDRRVIFLNSMKPFLSETRQKSIDDCVKILGLIALFEGITGKVGS